MASAYRAHAGTPRARTRGDVLDCEPLGKWPRSAQQPRLEGPCAGRGGTRKPARGRARLGIAGVGTRASSPSSDRANCSAAAKMPIPKTISGLRRRLAFIFGGHELELPCEAVDHEVLAGAVEASVQEGGYHQEESENQCCPSAHLWLLLSVPGTQPSTYDSPSCGVNECAAAPVSGTVPTAGDGEAATCRRAESDDKLPHPVLRQKSGCARFRRSCSRLVTLARPARGMST